MFRDQYLVWLVWLETAVKTKRTAKSRNQSFYLNDAWLGRRILSQTMSWSMLTKIP
jgi:hypothetical protein